MNAKAASYELSGRPDPQTLPKESWRVMKMILISVLALLISGAAYGAEPSPSDVNTGKPPDIDQEVFAAVRRDCIKRWGDDYDMRLFCETKQFNAVRKLRGDR